MNVYRMPQGVDYAQYLKKLGEMESSALHWGDQWRSKLLDICEYGIQRHGLTMPWAKLDHVFRLRSKEITILAGVDGERKSLILGQLLLHWAKEVPVCLASMEMPAEVSLHRMAQQRTGCAPSTQAGEEFSTWCQDRVLVYDCLGSVPVDRILGVIHFAALERGCKVIAIDNLMKLDIATDDYNAQRDLAGELSSAAKRLDISIVLVCHMRKPQQGEKFGKAQIFGSSQFTNQFDNAIGTKVNHVRLEAKQAQEARVPLTTAQSDALETGYDQVLTLFKQRQGIQSKSFGFYFDSRSLNITERERRVT